MVDSVTLDLAAAYTTSFFSDMNKEEWKALPDGVKTTIKRLAELVKHAKV